MQQFHDEVRIDAPVEQVWAFICDPAHLHDWATQTEWSDASGPLDRVGATVVQTARVMGHEMKGTLEVLEVEPQRLLRLRSDQGVNMVFKFEAQGGATLLILEGDYEMPHLPAFLQNLMSKSYIERNTHHQLENIKAVVEATVAVPA
jgi:ligand-binding SRPBCC domain-containing protein